jgi:hypothetical protein
MLQSCAVVTGGLGSIWIVCAWMLKRQKLIDVHQHRIDDGGNLFREEDECWISKPSILFMHFHKKYK